MKSSSVASIVVACSALAALVATSLISSKPSESPVEPVGASKSPVTARARFGEDASSHRAAP
ncbi:MAG: hypothetical protein KDD69_11575, partial [Bdellovibrionales bacterium]|nr:hypothetical protein [Bdellovibrionales bacterium]